MEWEFALAAPPILRTEQPGEYRVLPPPDWPEPVFLRVVLVKRGVQFHPSIRLPLLLVDEEDTEPRVCREQRQRHTVPEVSNADDDMIELAYRLSHNHPSFRRAAAIPCTGRLEFASIRRPGQQEP